MASTISLNVANFVTLKLTPENYPLWREQMLALAESQDMVGLLTGEKTQPTMYKVVATTDQIPTEKENTKEMSPDYIKWRKEDRLIRGWIIGTLSEEALSLVIGLDSSHSVWNALKEAYAQDSQEREFTLRQQLTYLKKEPNQSLAEHLRKFKTICDSLAAIGNPVPDKAKAYSLLANLGPKYESFTTTMLKPPMPSYSEVVSLLQGFEQRNSWIEAPNSVSYAFYGQRKQGQQQQNYNSRNNRNNQFTSKGRGFQATNNNFQFPNFAGNNTGMQQESNSRTPRPPPPGKRRMTTTEREMYKNEYCQLCGRQGHIAKICWTLPNNSINNDELPQALAALTMDTSIPDTEWTTDTGASNHMTSNSGMLSNLKKYVGHDSVFIGDGSPLKIDAIGDTLVSDGKNNLMLRDVLLVPQLTRNLLSVSQLTTQHPFNCEFTNDLFCIKE